MWRTSTFYIIQGGNMLVIDRVEKNIIVCQDLDNENMININIDRFVFSPKEGDICFLENGKYVKDKKETLKRKEYMSNICKDIFE